MDKNGDSYRRPDSQLENSCYNGSDKTDKEGYQEPNPNDIHAILPLDPFGMNVKVFTGWITDLPADGLDFIQDRAMMFGAQEGEMEIDEESYQSFSFEGLMEKELADGSFNSGFMSFCNIEKFLSYSHQDTQVAHRQTKEHEEGTGSCSAGDGGAPPHDALAYVLPFLGVLDLISVLRVCRTLRSLVEGDNLCWRRIIIDLPLSKRIDDDALVQLTNRADGELTCLSLVSCVRITNDGLRRVLESNPKLTELSVPGCTRLNIDGFVKDLKAFKPSGEPGIMHLRLGGRYDVSYEQFKELKLLLTENKGMLPKAHGPRFYHEEHSSSSCDDGRDIDIETCPRCKNARLVYDCPSKSCQGKPCRGCSFCIKRCFQCGQCIIDNEYEETFCLDMLCVDCWNNIFEEKQEENGAPFKQIFHQETRYRIRLFR